MHVFTGGHATSRRVRSTSRQRGVLQPVARLTHEAPLHLLASAQGALSKIRGNLTCSFQAQHSQICIIPARHVPRCTTPSTNKPTTTRVLSAASKPAVLSTACPSSRRQALEELQAFLGYKFRDLGLLDQACTHDPSGSCASYRELAFVGDAVLWLLFAEHAFLTYGPLENPTTGAWPTHLSRLLNRANCADTARCWGLERYLQCSIPSGPTNTMPQQQQHLLQHRQQHRGEILPLQAENPTTNSILIVGSFGTGAPAHPADSCGSVVAGASGERDSCAKFSDSSSALDADSWGGQGQYPENGWPENAVSGLDRSTSSLISTSCSSSNSLLSACSHSSSISSSISRRKSRDMCGSGSSSSSNSSSKEKSKDSCGSGSSTSGYGSRGSGSRGSGSSGKHAGVWTSDTLAEMFEGVVGALLQDCRGDMDVMRQLLQPWVASSLAASKQALAAAAAAAAAERGEQGRGEGARTGGACREDERGQITRNSTQKVEHAHLLTQPALAGESAVAAAASNSNATHGAHHSLDHGAAEPDAAALLHQPHKQQLLNLQRRVTVLTSAHPYLELTWDAQLHQLQASLEQQLMRHCNYAFSSGPLFQKVSHYMLALMTGGASCDESEVMRFLGFSIYQYAAADQAFSSFAQQSLCANKADHSLHADMQPAVHETDCCQQQELPGGITCSVQGRLRSLSSSSRSGSSGVCNQPGIAIKGRAVQVISKHASKLKTVRHRAKVWLWLLEECLWVPPNSHLISTSWKTQKQLLSRSLDLLLAAVYLDSTMQSALGVAGALLLGTPLVSHDKSWMPPWVNNGQRQACGRDGHRRLAVRKL